jgi:hypothetical protein
MMVLRPLGKLDGVVHGGWLKAEAPWMLLFSFRFCRAASKRDADGEDPSSEQQRVQTENRDDKWRSN